MRTYLGNCAILARSTATRALLPPRSRTPVVHHTAEQRRTTSGKNGRLQIKLRLSFSQPYRSSTLLGVILHNQAAQTYLRLFPLCRHAHVSCTKQNSDVKNNALYLCSCMPETNVNTYVLAQQRTYLRTSCVRACFLIEIHLTPIPFHVLHSSVIPSH